MDENFMRLFYLYGTHTMFYTYVLYSDKFDRIYIGQTDDLSYRLTRHNGGMVRSTKAYIPWKLIHYEEFEARSQAMKREKELKSHQGRLWIRENLLSSIHQVD
jgi:putative endonuclease